MRIRPFATVTLTLSAILFAASLAFAQDPATHLAPLPGNASTAPTSTTSAQWPAPAAPADMTGWGAHIQHAMSMLATSTPEHRNRVRILFYGQSITDGFIDWDASEAVLERLA